MIPPVARRGTLFVHRLFRFIGWNWAGAPLRRFDRIKRPIAGTTACRKRGGNETAEIVLP